MKIDQEKPTMFNQKIVESLSVVAGKIERTAIKLESGVVIVLVSGREGLTSDISYPRNLNPKDPGDWKIDWENKTISVPDTGGY